MSNFVLYSPPSQIELVVRSQIELVSQLVASLYVQVEKVVARENVGIPFALVPLSSSSIAGVLTVARSALISTRFFRLFELNSTNSSGSPCAYECIGCCAFSFGGMDTRASVTCFVLLRVQWRSRTFAAMSPTVTLDREIAGALPEVVCEQRREVLDIGCGGLWTGAERSIRFSSWPVKRRVLQPGGHTALPTPEHA